MISIVITSFKEPKTIGKAIDSFTKQKIQKDYELIVVAPDKETLDVAKSYQRKNKKIKLFVDPGKGKSYALNLVLKKLKGEITILSDGDVYVSESSINEILEKFKDKKVGCVSGRVVSQNSRDNMFGYWSHLLCDAAHRLRKKRYQQQNFLECSGYLWAFRNNIIKQFPLDVAEDTIVPIMFWVKGWKIAYSEKAIVFVKFPTNLKDFLNQKRRAAGSHDALGRYVDLRKIPIMKTFWNEFTGSFSILSFHKNLKEVFYTLYLFPFRLYIWISLFYNSRFKDRKYTDAWKRIESTK